MSNLDVLLFDLQDVGTRVYTFIHTLAYCLQACARDGKTMMVLDRPNPINGVRVEGSLLLPRFSSFVGLCPLPMRHAMTMGELALLYNSEFHIGCRLEVVPMQGWRRDLWFDQTALPWIMPSPNLPTLDSATVYPGTVLVEGSQVSEGRGTTRPFEFVGAPYINGRALKERLNKQRLPGVQFREVNFEPTFQKHAGSMCGGVQVHVLDREAFEPVLTGVAILWTIRALYPESFAWRRPPYEYESIKMPIDVLWGGDSIRLQIEGGMSLDEIRGSWQSDVSKFRAARERYLLYK